MPSPSLARKVCVKVGTIDVLIQGSIDMHLHAGPDARLDRRVDALQAAMQARELGMRAIVLKSHEYPTAPVAWIVSKIVDHIDVFGSMTLDLEAGGLNPVAVEASASLGAKVIWMPTLTAASEHRKRGLDGGVTIFDDKEQLLPVVGGILDIIKHYDIVLATGHVSVQEIFALVNEAKRRGLDKIVITHPMSTHFGTTLDLKQQQELANKGCYIEHCFVLTLPTTERLDPREIVNAVKAVGADHCILSTDLGQGFNLPPAEGMRMAIATLLRAGLSKEEVEAMAKTNPAKLLGLG